MTSWVIAPIAVVVGLVMGALGGGGAILTVPILTFGLNFTPHEAMTGSLIVVILSGLAGLWPHLRAGNVRLREGALFGAAGVFGASAGSFLSNSVSGKTLMSAFTVLLFVVAGLMFRKVLGTKPAATQAKPKSLPTVITAATIVGLLTGFFGVGGGFVVVPALTLALGFTMPVAVATSLLVIVINASVALTSRAVGGLEVPWVPVSLFAVFAVVGSLIGATFSRKLPGKTLGLSFATLLLGVATFTGYQAFTG